MAYNSDGYIMFDFSGVNFSRTNQTIDGIYKKCRDIIGTNKFIIVINANGKTPLPSVCSFVNNQYVIESVLYSFTISINDNLLIKKNTSASELIDDDHTSISTTYSSNKIEQLIAGSSSIDRITFTIEAGEIGITIISPSKILDNKAYWVGFDNYSITASSIQVNAEEHTISIVLSNTQLFDVHGEVLIV